MAPSTTRCERSVTSKQSMISAKPDCLQSSDLCTLLPQKVSPSPYRQLTVQRSKLFGLRSGCVRHRFAGFEQIQDLFREQEFWLSTVRWPKPVTCMRTHGIFLLSFAVPLSLRSLIPILSLITSAALHPCRRPDGRVSLCYHWEATCFQRTFKNSHNQQKVALV